jgi:hypothetical protein
MRMNDYGRTTRCFDERSNKLAPANSRRPLCVRRLPEIRCSSASSRLGSPAAVAERGRSAYEKNGFDKKPMFWLCHFCPCIGRLLFVGNSARVFRIRCP